MKELDKQVKRARKLKGYKQVKLNKFMKNKKLSCKALNKSEFWKEHWQGMPEYIMKNLKSFRSINIHFRNQEDVDKFSKLLGQKIQPKAKSYWYPILKPRIAGDKRYVDKEDIDES